MKKGIIKIHKDLYIEQYKTSIIHVFARVIPLEIRYDLFTDRFILFCESDHFDSVKEGEVIPEYTAVFIVKEGVPVFQNFVKL